TGFAGALMSCFGAACASEIDGAMSARVVSARAMEWRMGTTCPLAEPHVQRRVLCALFRRRGPETNDLAAREDVPLHRAKHRVVALHRLVAHARVEREDLNVISMLRSRGRARAHVRLHHAAYVG